MPSSVYCASIFCWSLTSSAHILTVVLQVQGFLLTDNRGIPQSSEFSMLNLWKHPKTQSIRLYLAPKLIKPALAAIGESWDPKSVKAWLEEVDSYWSIKVTVRAEEPAPPEAIDALKSVLLEAAGLTGNETWADLVAQAETSSKPQPPKSKATPRAQADSPSKGSRAAEAARLDISKIKMPGKITIEVDHRETNLISELLGKHPDITVKRVTLDLADFRVEDGEGNELLIERKRCIPTESSPDARNDFEASVVSDGRLFDQSERLKFKAANSDHQIIPIILLEGEVHQSRSMLIQQIDGALSFLAAIQRVNILTSYGANHSAYQIAKLASHFCHGLYSPVTMHKSKPKALWDQKKYVLESMPGVSSGIAEALLERFGSVRAVAMAEEHELASVKGVGPKRSREIIRVLGEL